MDKLSPEQADSINKMTSDAIKAELIKIGYQTEVVTGFNREQLKAHLAAHVFEQQHGATARDPGTTSEAVAMRQIQLRELELKAQAEQMKMQLEQQRLQFDQQRLQFEQEKLRVQAEAATAAAAREAEIQRERLRFEAETVSP
jgi:hypothetical protein